MHHTWTMASYRIYIWIDMKTRSDSCDHPVWPSIPQVANILRNRISARTWNIFHLILKTEFSSPLGSLFQCLIALSAWKLHLIYSSHWILLCLCLSYWETSPYTSFPCISTRVSSKLLTFFMIRWKEELISEKQANVLQPKIKKRNSIIT